MAEYNAAGTMLKRYIHGPNAEVDDPIAEYTGTSTAISARRNLYADARGSIALSTNGYGTAPQINSYDEYGQPDANNTGRFQSTGQVWLPELGMYYCKARIYSPKLGRFMQTDPIGYEDNVNLYGYTANDPVNGIDPSGLFSAKSFAQAFLANYGPAFSGGDRGNDRSKVNERKETPNQARTSRGFLEGTRGNDDDLGISRSLAHAQEQAQAAAFKVFNENEGTRECRL